MAEELDVGGTRCREQVKPLCVFACALCEQSGPRSDEISLPSVQADEGVHTWPEVRRDLRAAAMSTGMYHTAGGTLTSLPSVQADEGREATRARGCPSGHRARVPVRAGRCGVQH
jgi:hypothetical protein